MSAEKNVVKSFTVWEKAPQSAFLLAELISYFSLIFTWYVFVTAVFENGTERKADDIEE